MNEQLNITGVGIAVAVAVIIAGGLLFFGPSIFSLFNPASTQAVAQPAGVQANSAVNSEANTVSATNPTNQPTTMQDQENPSAASAPSDIPANVTQLEAKDLVVGTGTEAQAGDSVTVNYVGMLTNGTVFDASANHGTTGFTFNLGAGQVIKGWDQGVVGMKVGGKRELIIPASLAYGSQAVGSIPANSTLVFQIDLLNVTPGN